MQEFKYVDPQLKWWIKFSTTPDRRLLACGNTSGRLSIWDVASSSEDPLALAWLESSEREKKERKKREKDNRQPAACREIRQTTCSSDGRIIIGCGPRNSITRWDHVGPVVYTRQPSDRPNSRAKH